MEVHAKNKWMRKGDGGTGALMTGTMKHAKPEWRNPRSVGAQFFDRRNESKTTRRGTGATCTN